MMPRLPGRSGGFLVVMSLLLLQWDGDLLVAGEQPPPLRDLNSNCWTVAAANSSVSYRLVDGLVNRSAGYARAACDAVGGNMVDPAPGYEDAARVWSGHLCDAQTLLSYELSGTAPPPKFASCSTNGSTVFDAQPMAIASSSTRVSLCQRPVLPQRGEVVQWGPPGGAPVLWAAFLAFPVAREVANQICSRLGGELGFVPSLGLDFIWAAMNANPSAEIGAVLVPRNATSETPCALQRTPGMWTGLAADGATYDNGMRYAALGLTGLQSSTTFSAAPITQMDLNGTAAVLVDGALTAAAPFLCTGVLVQVTVSINATTAVLASAQQPFITVSVKGSPTMVTRTGTIRVYLLTSDGNVAVPATNYFEFSATTPESYETPLVPTTTTAATVVVTALVDERDADYVAPITVVNSTVTISTTTLAGGSVTFSGPGQVFLGVGSSATCTVTASMANAFAPVYLAIAPSPSPIYAATSPYVYFPVNSTKGTFTVAALQSGGTRIVTSQVTPQALQYGPSSQVVVAPFTIAVIYVLNIVPFIYPPSGSVVLDPVANPTAVLSLTVPIAWPFAAPLPSAVLFTLTVGTCGDYVVVAPTSWTLPAALSTFSTKFSLTTFSIPFASPLETCTLTISTNASVYFTLSPWTFQVQTPQMLQVDAFPTVLDSTAPWWMQVTVLGVARGLWAQVNISCPGVTLQTSGFNFTANALTWSSRVAAAAGPLAEDTLSVATVTVASCSTPCPLSAHQWLNGTIVRLVATSNVSGPPLQLLPLSGANKTFTVDELVVLTLMVRSEDLTNATLITVSDSDGVNTVLQSFDFVQCFQLAIRCASVTRTSSTPKTLTVSVVSDGQAVTRSFPFVARPPLNVTAVVFGTAATGFLVSLRLAEALRLPTARVDFLVAASPCTSLLLPPSWTGAAQLPSSRTLTLTSCSGPGVLVLNQTATTAAYANVTLIVPLLGVSPLLTVTSVSTNVIALNRTNVQTVVVNFTLSSWSTETTWSTSCTPVCGYDLQSPLTIPFNATPAAARFDSSAPSTRITFTFFTDGVTLPVLPKLLFGCFNSTWANVSVSNSAATLTVVTSATSVVTVTPSAPYLIGVPVTVTYSLTLRFLFPFNATFTMIAEGTAVSGGQQRYNLTAAPPRTVAAPLIVALVLTPNSTGYMSIRCSVADIWGFTPAPATIVTLQISDPVYPAIRSPAEVWVASPQPVVPLTWFAAIPNVVFTSLLTRLSTSVVSITQPLTASTFVSTFTNTTNSATLGLAIPKVSSALAIFMMNATTGQLGNTPVLPATTAVVRLRPLLGMAISATATSVVGGSNMTILFTMGNPQLSFASNVTVSVTVAPQALGSVSQSTLWCSVAARGRCPTATAIQLYTKPRHGTRALQITFTVQRNVSAFYVGSGVVTLSLFVTSPFTQTTSTSYSRSATRPSRSPPSATATFSHSTLSVGSATPFNSGSIADNTTSVTAVTTVSSSLGRSQATASATTFVSTQSTSATSSLRPTKSTSKPRTWTRTGVPRATDPPPVWMAPSMKDVTTATVSTVAAAAAIISAPAAMQSARAMAVLALSDCYFKHDVPLSFPMSAWPELAIGPSTGAYYRGAVIANVGAMFVASLAGFLVACIAGIIKNTRAPTRDIIARGVRRTRYPGCLIVPGSLLLIGTSTCVTATAVHGQQPAFDAPIAVLGAAAVCAYVVCCWRVSYTFPVKYGVAVQRQKDSTTSTASSLLVRLFGQETPLWRPRPPRAGESVDPAVKLKAVYPLYSKYHAQARCYYAFDALLTVCVGFVQGTMPSERRHCVAAIGAISAVCVFALIAVALVRPNDTFSKNVVLVVVASLTVVAAALVTIGFALNRQPAVAAGQAIAAAAGYTSAGSCILLTIGRFIMVRRRAWAREATARSGGATSLILPLVPYEEDELMMLNARLTPPPSPSAFALLDDDDDTADAGKPSTFHELDSLLAAPSTLRISRTEEGQRLFEELEALLGHQAAGAPVVVQAPSLSLHDV